MSHGGNIMKLDTTQLENLRLHAIEAGITYINDCAQEPKIFEEFGGDMIFLFRNLVHSVGLNGQICNIQNDSDYKHDIERSLQAASCFAELLARWTTENTRMTSEIEMEEILNTVEALHTLAQLGIKDDDQLPQPKEIALMLTAYEHPIIHNTTMNQDNDTNVKVSKIRRKAAGSRSSSIERAVFKCFCQS
jgi:hypothetical protein